MQHVKIRVCMTCSGAFSSIGLVVITATYYRLVKIHFGKF